MKKIIVTGGSGFIGSNLVNYLIKKKYFVVNIDKLTYSSNKYFSEIRNKIIEIKSNHKKVVEYMNEQVNICTQNSNSVTPWGENCKNIWTSSLIVEYILKNLKLLGSGNNRLTFDTLLILSNIILGGKPASPGFFQ